jgi:hypothetical protein
MGLLGDSSLVSPAGITREGRGGLLSKSTPLVVVVVVIVDVAVVLSGLNKFDATVEEGCGKKFSLPEVNNSLRRRLRGFSLTTTGGGGVVL